ncbi:MAG: trigger factor [Mariprofundales bacterium]
MIQVEVQPLEKLHAHSVRVHIPKNMYQAEYNVQLGKIKSKVSLPGFRNGRVPRTVMERQFGKQLKQETAQALLEKHLSYIIAQSELNPAVDPRIEEESLVWDDGLKFSLTVAEWPVIALEKLATIGIERKHITINDADIETVQTQFLQQPLEYTAADTAYTITDGDRVELAFHITIDGEVVRDDQEDAKSESVDVDGKLKEGVPELYNALLGHNVGDDIVAERQIEPEENNDVAEEDKKSLAVSYKAKILAINSPSIALNITEACDFHELCDVDDLAEILAKYMQDKVDVFEADAVSNTASNAMLKTFNPQVSDLIMQHFMLEQKKDAYKRFQEEEGMTSEQATGAVNDTKYLNKLSEEVRVGTRLNSLWIAIGKAANIKIDDATVFAHIEELASSSDPSMRKEMINFLYKNNYDSIANQLFYKHCNDYVLQHINVDDVHVSYTEWAASENDTHIDISRLRRYKPTVKHDDNSKQIEQTAISEE